MGRAAATCELAVDRLDAFEEVDWKATVPSETLSAFEALSEDEVKHRFAAILGEAYVPKDWGGERSDLNTARLFVDGSAAGASFIFKGPGDKRGKMVISSLGKNGDQIARALTEGPDVVIVQYWRQIDVEVRHMLEAYCFERTHKHGIPTKWLVLDGQTSARILDALGKI